MTAASALGLAVATLILAASPGPGVFATLARALASGLAPALAVVLGIVAGDVLYLLLAIYGLAFVAGLLGDLFYIVKWVGAGYLIWLGYRIWVGSGGRPSSVPSPPAGRLGELSSGLVITLGNPKVILFYMGFLPTFVDLAALTNIEVGLVVGIVAIVVGTVLLVYAWSASRARRVLADRRARRLLDRGAAAVMVAAGVLVAVRQ